MRYDMEGHVVPVEAVLVASFETEAAMIGWRKRSRRAHRGRLDDAQFFVWDRQSTEPYQVWEVQR